MDLLSDSGYYVVDNLPAPLLHSFLLFAKDSGARFRKTALLVDIDSQENQRLLTPILGGQSSRPESLQIIFLDANTPTVVRRYSETRRPHPGFDPAIDTSLSDAIQRERQRLQKVKESANLILDTSDLTVHQLKAQLREFLLSLGAVSALSMRVNFLSFGFKRGAPIDCDLLADVRFLRNPHFVEDLRDHDGREPAVKRYVFDSPDAGDFVEKYTDLLRFLLPRYQVEGKAYVNIGIGCTGGKHRSVAIAEALAERLKVDSFLISVKHRDL